MIMFLLSVLLLQIWTTTGQGIACSVITYQLASYRLKCTATILLNVLQMYVANIVKHVLYAGYLSVIV